MPLVLKDRVQETSTTTGTGSFTLNGAVSGFMTFSAEIGVGNTTYYTITNAGTTEWEVGIGTLTGATTLARTTLLDSSTGSFISFTAGTKSVFVTYPAIEAVPKSFLDGAYETVSFNPSTNVYAAGSYVVSANINANETSNLGVTFSTDGLNMYTSGDTSDAIDQYTVTNPFDVSAITYLRTFSVAGLTTQPRGLTFSPDGLNMYVMDDSGNRVGRYILSTAWNISTAGTLTTFSVSAQTTALGFSIEFNPTGTLMTICNQTSTLYTYTLTTAWVIATGVTFTRSAVFDATLRGFTFNSDGLQLFTYTSAGIFRRRTLTTAFDISTASAINQTITLSASNFPVATYGLPTYGLHLNDAVTGISAGQRLFVVSTGINTSTEYVYQFELGAANDLTLMLNPLFDVTTATSRQINITPGTAPVYIGRLGVPGTDFTGMTKQLRIVTATVIINNASYINTMNGTNMSLAAGDILQATYDGTAWNITDLDNTLKTNLYGLANQIAGLVAWNPTGSTFLPRTIVTGGDPGIVVGNGNGGGNPTISNTGIRTLNQRSNTANINLWWHRTFWYTYGESGGSSPWLNVGGNLGTYFFKQIGGGFNNTDTPDLFYWDKNTDANIDSNYPNLGYPRQSIDRNAYLRRFYYYLDRWYQREMIYIPEGNWPTTARAVRSMSELVMGLNWNEGEDTPDDTYTYGYAIPFQGDASQNPTGTRVTGNYLISGTTASPTILSQAVTTTSVVNIHVNGRSFVFTAWTADGAVNIKAEGSGYGQYINTVTFAANTTFYYNYWCEGDNTVRTFVKVFFSSTATANWSYQIGEDNGGTVWRGYIQNTNRANYIGGFWRDANGFVFPAARVERIWSNKSMALPLTTNTVARPFTIQCRFRVDDITTQDQNVFWIAATAAPTNPNGIRVRINDGVIDRRLSITLGTTANAAATGNIVDKLRCWQFNATGEFIIVTFVWNPLDTAFPGRLYVNGAMMFKTASNPFGATTAWHNIGATVDGTANGFVGVVDYLETIPECWGAYLPQGTALIDVDAGNAGWTNATNNGGADVSLMCRNNFGYRGYLRGSSWGIGANIRADNYWDGPLVGSAADTFTLTGDTVSASNVITLSKTTGGFSRNSGYFYVTGANLPTTANTYAFINYGDKTFTLNDVNGAANATLTATGTTFTFVRVNGTNGAGGFLQMPDNAIFVAKSNNISVTFTNELAGVNSSTTTTTCAFPDITFTATADAAINDIYTTQNSAGNNTTVRALQAALAIGPKQYTLSGTGLTATSATIDNARVIAVTWDGAGAGLHQIQISRNRDAAVTAGATITARFVPNVACGYNDFDLLGGNNAKDGTNGETDGYSLNAWWYSSQRDMKAMMVTCGIGQWRYTRVAPPGGVYDSGIFKATSTTFAKNLYLGYGSIGYLVNYGTTGDFNQSTVNPVVSTIAWAATNGMNSDGFSLTVVAGNFYRIMIYPFGSSLTGEYEQ
jgi:hypothetical protein